MEYFNALELKKFFLFQAMQDDDIVEFCSYCQRRDYFQDAHIFYQKDRGETMYVILKGEVQILRENGDLITTLCEGDFFGEVALFDYALRTAAALSKGDTTLLEIHRSDFNNLFAKKPQIVAKLLYQMMTEMSRRLRAKNNPGGGLIF